MFDSLARILRDENGATMVEYSLMLALIALVCISVVAVIGGKVFDYYDDANTAWPL